MSMFNVSHDQGTRAVGKTDGDEKRLISSPREGLGIRREGEQRSVESIKTKQWVRSSALLSCEDVTTRVQELLILLDVFPAWSFKVQPCVFPLLGCVWSYCRRVSGCYWLRLRFSF
ncbi:hypothetical protein YC2023_036630 [Brassica napus]